MPLPSGSGSERSEVDGVNNIRWRYYNEHTNTPLLSNLDPFLS